MSFSPKKQEDGTIKYKDIDEFPPIFRTFATRKVEKDIMNLFKVNRVIYDKVKAEDASIYNEIMDAFKTTKARFAKAE